MTGRTSEQAVGSHWVVGNVMAAFSLFGDAARIVSACKRLFLNGQCIEKMCSSPLGCSMFSSLSGIGCCLCSSPFVAPSPSQTCRRREVHERQGRRQRTAKTMTTTTRMMPLPMIATKTKTMMTSVRIYRMSCVLDTPTLVTESVFTPRRVWERRTPFFFLLGRQVRLQSEWSSASLSVRMSVLCSVPAECDEPV